MIYKMYAAISAGDGLASIDIQNDGRLLAMNLIVDPIWTANNQAAIMEISFMSSSTFSTNDVRGSLALLAARYSFSTNGASQNSVSQYFGDMGVQLVQGERIFLHGSVITTTGGFTAYLYVDDGVDQKPARRRR